MPLFFHDIVLSNDVAGFSIWLQEHYLEHQQFVSIFQSKPTPIFVPDYNFAIWGDNRPTVQAWLEAHYTAHQALRTPTGVAGIDLADVDLAESDQWQTWMENHAAEHADIRVALGILN